MNLLSHLCSLSLLYELHFSHRLTCFRVRCNKYIIWPCLKVLNFLPVFREIVCHWYPMKVKQFRSSRCILLLKGKKHTKHFFYCDKNATSIV